MNAPSISLRLACSTVEPALQGHLKLNIKNNHKIGRFARSATIEMTTRMHSSRMRTVHHSGRLGKGVSAQRGCLPRGCGGGVCLMGVYTPLDPRQTPPSVNRITDRCKSITFPKLLLRTVINGLQGTHKAGGLRDCSHDANASAICNGLYGIWCHCSNRTTES